jgi:hypothetical protein
VEVAFDISADSMLGAGFGLGKTSILVLILGGALFLFNRVSTKYCIQVWG